ncbi:MAG TPA: type II and III secretion system protein family protein [Sphingomicrobium sp.]|nr:type II and III secretion system protein family protein [Sphingomicrobium sp.]
MTSITVRNRAPLGTALAALALGLGTIAVAAPAPAAAQQRPAGTFKPTGQLLLSIGEGQVVSLPNSVSEVWTSNPEVADVHVTNARQINLFGKGFGEATIVATSSSGAIVYSTNVRVSQNINSVDEMLRVAMPDSNIRVMNVGQMAVMTGTVASPEDSAQAELLVRTLLNPGIDVNSPGAALKIMPINRLKSSTPLQVNLRVRIAEVNRSLVKSIGVNLFSQDGTGGTRFGINQGSGNVSGVPFSVAGVTGGTALGLAGKFLGLDLIGTLDLAESDGLVSTLAEPNLTALSGETASFLAGGEFPIPVSQETGSVTIEYKQYGVGLAFTPIVLADGRISMRVRPEVSELSSEGSLRLNGFNVPAVTTRRAETTVELGSGQSFMIAGLLRNANTNNIEKAPFLGDLPILGALFRSTSYRRSETELVIIVTPYLVRPVSGQLALPTDGYRAPTTGQMVVGGKSYTGRSGPTTSATPAVTRSSAAPGFKL